MSPINSFEDQALHYFIRASHGQPAGTIESPAAWRGDELRLHPDRWLVELTEPELVGLRDGAAAQIEAGVAMSETTSANFDVGPIERRLAPWRHTLAEGTGVLCVRGLPVREWGEEVATRAYWGLGHHLGTPGAQNPDGDLLGRVTDHGDSETNPMGRKYRTTSDIAFHCDTADVVGLLCMRAARQGGESRLASSVTVFNELARRRPDRVPQLFEPFAIDRRDEQGPGEVPWFEIPPCAWDGQQLRTFWHSDYMRSAARHEDVVLPSGRLGLMDAYDGVASEDGVHLDMSLAEGDMQFISNHTVIHSRTAYIDHDDPTERRKLLRLWLSLPVPA